MSRVRKSTVTREQRLSRLERTARRLGLEPEREGGVIFIDQGTRLYGLQLRGRTAVFIKASVLGEQGATLDSELVVSDDGAERALVRIAATS